MPSISCYLLAREREKNRRWEARERSETDNQRKMNGIRERGDDGVGIQIRSRGERRMMADDENRNEREGSQGRKRG